MSTQVELQQMLELALATPEIGVVNFNVLRSFLCEIIRHIEVQEKVITVTEDGEHKSVYEAVKEASKTPQSRLSEPDPSPVQKSQSSQSQEIVSEKTSPTGTPSSSFKQLFR